GLVNNPLAIILPSLVFPPGVFLMRVYIDDAVSNELIEAGRIDGAGELHIFSKIAFRLLMPGFATVLILAFVSTWNNYFLPLVMLNSSEYFPVTVGLSQWYAAATSGSGGAVLFTIVMAGALVSILPVIAAFLIMQRYWQGGLSAGGVKA
ncbi:MAG TPA: carbohydrate ABC transporter permease, partial [Inquilinus sp.]|nr:carbohydrate ABC transporter permease [Inquilinus sp.]